MDFSALLADLRDVAEKYKGQNSDPKVATIVFADMFIKILKRTEMTSKKFEDRIVMLWVTLNQLAASYKDLAPVPERHELCQYIFILCAKTVLNIEWQQLDENDRNRQNFTSTVQSVHELLKDLGFNRFHLILSLMKTHWTHPVLSRIMSGEEEDESEEGLNYILGEDPEILKLRVEMMIDENCEEFALNLCCWSLRHPDLANDQKVQQLYLFLLHKQQQFEKLQEECSKIECHNGIKIINALEKKDNCQELCVRLAQTFLVQDWIRPERKCCTQDLLKLWIRLQYLADKDQEKFLDSIWAVAKVSRVTEQIGTLIDTVKKECGFTFFQLYVDLCIYAINIDKGFLEKEVVEGDMEAVRKRQFAVSKTCHRLADLFMDSNFRISKISVLTAFALNPTQGAFELVNKLFWIIKKQKKSENIGKINPATVYEVERLLNMLRPFYLNPELPWKELIPLCRKYKVEQEENIKANISPKMTAPLSFGLSTPSPSSCVKEISQQSSMPESSMQRNICNFINLTGKKQTSSSTKSTVRAGVSSMITEMPQKIQSRDTFEVSKTSNMAKRDLQLQTKEQNLCAWNASVLPGTSGLDFSALKIGDVGIEMLRRHYTLQSFGESANLTDDNKGQLGHHRTAKEIQSKMEAQLLAHDISMLQLKHKSRKNESKVERDSAQDDSRMAMDSSKTHNSQKMNALGRSMQRSLDPDQISALLSLTNQTKSVNDTSVRSSSVPVNRFQKDLVSFSAAQKMALGREPHEMSPDSYRQHVMELIKAATATREVSSYCEKPPKKSSGSPKKKTVSRQKSVGSSPSISPSTSHLQKSSPSFIENSNNARLKGPALSQTDPAKIASMIEASGFSNKLQPKMKAESNRKHVSKSLQDCQNKNSSLLKPVISMVVPKSVAEGAMTGAINKEALFKTISELISEKVLDKDSSVPRTVVSNIPIVSKNPLHQSSHLTVGTTTTGSIAVKTSIVAKSGHSYTSEQLSGKTETSQSIPSRYSRSLSLPSFISSTSSPLIQQISSKERVGVSIENSFIDQATGTLNRSHSMEMVEMNTAISSCSNSYGSTFGMGAQPNVGLPALSNNVCVTDSQGFNLVALSNSNTMQPMSIFNATSFAGLPDLSGLMNENIDIQQLLNTQPALLDSPVTCASLHNYLQQTSIASMPVSTQSMLQNITQVHSHGPVLGTQQIVTLSGVANVSASPQVITTFVPRHSAMQDSVQMSDQHGQIQVHTASSPFCQQTMPDLQVVKEPIELTSQQSVIHQLSLPNQGIVQESVQFTGQQSTFQTASLPLVQQTLQRQEIVQDSVRWAEQQPLIQIQNSCSPFSQQSAVVDAGNVDLPGQILTIPQNPVMQHTVNVISVQNATTPTFIQQIPTPELDANVVQQILSIIEQGPGTPTRLDGSSAPHTSNQHFIHQQNDDFGQTGKTLKMGLQPAVCKTSYILPKGMNQPLIDKTKMLLLKKDNFAGSGKTVSEAIEQIVSQKFAKELQKGAKPPDVNTKPATIAKSRPAKGKTNVLSSTSCVQSDMRVAASAQLASVKNTYENAASSSSGALNLPVQLERPSSVPLKSSFNLQKTSNTRSANESHACDPKLLGLLLENKVLGIQTSRTSSSTASVPSPVLQPGAVPCANVSSSSTAVGQSSDYQASSTNGTSSRLLGMASISSSSSVGEMSQNVTSFLTAVSGILQVAPKVPVKSSSPGDQTQIPASVTVTQIPIPRAFMGSAWSTVNAGVKKGDGQVVSSKNTSISTTCVSPSSKVSFSPLPALSVSASQEKSSITYSIASALSTVKESYSSSTLSQITSHNQIRAVPVPGKSCTVQTCVSPTTSVVTSMAASTSIPVTTVVQCLTTSVPATYHQGTFSVNAQNTVNSPKTSAIQTSASDISCSFTNSSGSCSIDGSSCSFSSNRARSQPYSTSLIESLLLRGNTAVSTGPSESIQTKNGSELLDDRLLRKLLFQQSGRQQISEHVQDNFKPVYQQTLPSPVLNLIGADSVPSSAFGTQDHLLDPFSTTKQASYEENDKDSEPLLNNVPEWNQKSCRMEEKQGLNSPGVSVFTPCLTVAASTFSSQYSDSGSAEQMNRKQSENLCSCDVTLLSAGRGEQSQTGQGALLNSKSCTSESFREGSALTAHSSNSRSASSSDCDVLQQMQVEENDGISGCLSEESCFAVKPTAELKLISDITDFKTQSNIQQLALENGNSGAHNRLKNISDSDQKSTLNEYWAYEGGKVVMKTNSSAVLVNKCAICEQLFKSVEELRNHVVTVCKHSQKNQMSDVKDFEFKTQFSCSNCNFMSISEKIAKKHISNCKIFGTAGVENFESQSNVAKLTLVFTCKMCGKISKDKDDIHEHVSKLCTELKKFSSGREQPSQSLCWEMSELPEKEIPISGRRHSLVNSVDILEEVKVGELTTRQLTSADEERKMKDQDGTLINTQQQDLKLADEKVSKVRNPKVYSEKDIFKVSDWDSPRKLSSTVPKVSDWDSPRKLSSVNDSLDGKAKMEQAVGHKFIYDKGENSVHIDQVEHYAEEEMAIDSEDIGPRESSKEKENMNLEDIEITSTLEKDKLKSNDNREVANVDTKALVNISKSTYCRKDYSEHMQNYHVTTDKYEVAKGKTVCENKSQKKVKMKTLSTEEIRKQRLKGLRDKRLIKRRKFLDEEMDDSHKEASSKRLVRRAKIRQPVSAPKEKRHECTSCAGRFYLRTELIKHIGFKHLQAFRFIRPDRFICRYCKTMFPTCIGVLNHMIQHTQTILDSVNRKQHAADQRSRLAAKLNEIRKTSSRSTQSRLAAQKVTRKSLRFTSSSHRNHPIITDSTQDSSGKDIKGQKSFVKKPASKVTRDKAFNEEICFESQNGIQTKRLADKVAAVKEERVERRGRPRKLTPDPKKEMKKTDDKGMKTERQGRPRYPIPETSARCPIPETSPRCPIPETSPRGPIPETKVGKLKMFKNGEIRVERRGRPRKYPIIQNKEVNCHDRNSVTELVDSIPLASSKDVVRETRSGKKYLDVLHNSDSDTRQKKESRETEEERNKTGINQTPQKDQYCKQDDDDQKREDSVKDDIMPTRRSVRFNQSTKEQAETEPKEVDEVKNTVQKVDNRVETRQLRASVDKMQISDDKSASDLEAKLSRTPKKGDKLDLKADNDLGSSKIRSTRSKVKHEAAIGSDSEDNISLYSNSESTQGDQRTIDSLRIRRVSTRRLKLDTESKAVGNDNFLKAENARNSHNKHKSTSVESDQTKSLLNMKSSSRNNMPLHFNSADNILSETDKKDISDRSPSRRRSTVSKDNVLNSSDGSDDKISKEKNIILKERQSSRGSILGKSRKRKRSFSGGSNSSLSRHNGQKSIENDTASKDTSSETERITRSKITSKVESQAHDRKTRSKQSVSGDRALDNEKKKEIETQKHSFSPDGMNPNIKEKSKRSARSVSPIVEKETLKTEGIRKTVQDTKKMSNDKSPIIGKESETKLKMDHKSISRNKSVQIVTKKNCDKQEKTAKVKKSGSSYTFKQKFSLTREDKGRSRKLAARIVKKKAAVNSFLVKSRSSLRKAKLNLAKSQRLKTSGQNSSVSNSTKKCVKMEQLCKSGYVKLSLQRLSVLLPADDEEFAAVKSPPTTVLKVKEKSPVACRSVKDTSKTVTIKEDNGENLHQGKRKGNDFISNQKDSRKKIKMQKSDESNETIEVDEEQGTKKASTVENSETDGHKDTESSIIKPPSFETAFRQFASGNSGVIVQPLNHKELNVIQKDSLHSKLPTSRNFLSAFEEFASSPITYSRRRNYMNSQISIAASQYIPVGHLNRDSSRNLYQPDESLADHNMKSLSKDAKDDEMSHFKDSTGTQTEEVAMVDESYEAQTEGVSKGDRYQLPDLDKNVSNIQYPDIKKSKGSYMSSFLTYVANYTNDGTGVDSENSCDGKDSDKLSLQSERLKNFREQHNSVGFTWDMSDGDVQCPTNSSTSKKRTSREQKDSKNQTKSNVSKNHSEDGVQGNAAGASSSTSVKKTEDFVDKPISSDLAMEKKAPGKSDKSPSSLHKETSTKYYMPRKPVRHIYHGGKVWEIQKGSIKSTIVVQSDRQVTATDLSKKTLSKMDSGVHTVQEDKLRLRSSSSQEEAHDGTAQDWSREKSVQAGDLNNYICKTLNEIRRQRNQQRNPSNSKWQVQKKKPDVKKFPYSFTRSRKIH
ncbi:hypothetical protein CHS0354_002404 [Potamilus streckersoni]|uniref:C2H2-type domain-containing protein n=1 Tax=Potamilus streckersoni TaxID=2493646 RepID=A0AAE0T9B5_9BIVA|nr:hypothetical protein CHS0354_002404 [Potamilus streckersoni]